VRCDACVASARPAWIIRHGPSACRHEGRWCYMCSIQLRTNYTIHLALQQHLACRAVLHYVCVCVLCVCMCVRARRGACAPPLLLTTHLHAVVRRSRQCRLPGRRRDYS
jgi:hypothetical protein